MLGYPDGLIGAPTSLPDEYSKLVKTFSHPKSFGP
jgi:hypothetical protein